MKLAVAPGKFPRGIERPGFRDHTYDFRAEPGTAENTRRVRAEFIVSDFADALTARYPTDAHLVSYLVLRDGLPLPAQPRVNKSGLSWLLDQGFTVETELLFCDVDNPGHQPWTPALLDAAAATDVPHAGVYYTAHGRRFITRLDEPVPVASAENYLNAWLTELEHLGLSVDWACRDWTRLFRLPNVRRAGADYVSPVLDLSRLQPRAIVPKLAAGARSVGLRGLAA